MQRSRRQMLALFGALGVGTLAGCSDSSNSTDSENGGPETSTPTSTTALSPTETPAPDPETEEPAAKFVPNDSDTGHYFGSAAALSNDGTVALIGAYRDDDPHGYRTGSAYVFTYDGEWSQQAKLSPDTGESVFGRAVALSGDGSTALIGAPYDEEVEYKAGSAYVFTDDGGWRQQAKLTADDGDMEDLFGDSVALSGDGSTALIGAPLDRDPNGGGSTYVFTDDGDWRQQTKLAADDGTEGDRFGESVALSGDGTTALIGAYRDENHNGGGSAYVFTGDGDWRQRAKVTANDGDEGDGFGSTAALSSDGTIALIGAPDDEDPHGTNAGSAYLFTGDGGWSQQTKLAAVDGNEEDQFGDSVALSGDGTTALVGACGDEEPSGDEAGSAYLFTTDGGWSLQAKLVADDGESEDLFGYSAALSTDGALALVGASRDNESDETDAGSAYVFE